MELNKLLAIAIDALEDVKAQDIRVYDTTGKTSAFDRAIVVSGTSNRQTRALAQHVSSAVKDARGKVRGIEGTETGEWVLVDLGAVVVHCMQPAIRQYYNLEELYGPEEMDLTAVLALRPSQCAPEALEKARQQAQ